MPYTIKILTVSFGLLAYIPIIWNIYQNKTRSSFCTWMLWTLLNIVVLLSLVRQGAPYLIAVAYTIGTFIIAILSITKNKLHWQKTDTLITGLVLTSILVLMFADSYVATIVGSIASLVAGIPEIIKVINNPKNASKVTAGLFILSNTFVIIFTSDRVFINIVYPLTWCLYWLIILSLSVRKTKSTE